MFLSLVLLNPGSRAALLDAADAQRLHARLLAAFPSGIGGSARAAVGLLYRIERASNGQVAVIVQSGIKPDWSALGPNYVTAPPSVKEIGPLIGRIQTGQWLRFRLRANPTKRLLSDASRARQGLAPRTDNGGLSGKRVGLLTESDRITWLARKASQSGFIVTASQVDVRPEPDVHGVRSSGRVTLTSVTFTGVLTVSDGARFGEALRHGIGTGKAYGFGLLSVAPCE